MKQILQILAIFILATSCGELNKARNVVKGVTGKDPITAKDLSKLPSDEVIKTKYLKLNFLCHYDVSVEKVSNGTIESQTKSADMVWDIVTNTVFTKTLTNQDQVLNLSIANTLNITLALDSKFNSKISFKPNYEFKTTDSNGNVVTTLKSDSNSTAIALEENQKAAIVEITTGATSVSGINKIKMSCSLESTVRPEYK